MQNPINRYIKILSDNRIERKLINIPDDCDNQDEILAELHEFIEEEGQPPDEYMCNQVNGFDNTKKLEEYLIKNFNQFRFYFIDGKYDKKNLLIKEIENQIHEISGNLNILLSNMNQYSDDLYDLLNLKAHYADELIDFINNPQKYITKSDTSDSDGKLTKPKNLTYKWLKGDDKLKEFYNKLKSNKLIAETTSEKDFIYVFSAKPLKEIKKPIQWEKGPKLFAYFFNKMTEHKFIPNRPKWVNLNFCFTYLPNNGNSYKPVPESIKSHITEIETGGEPKEHKIIDSFFNI